MAVSRVADFTLFQWVLISASCSSVVLQSNAKAKGFPIIIAGASGAKQVSCSDDESHRLLYCSRVH